MWKFGAFDLQIVCVSLRHKRGTLCFMVRLSSLQLSLPVRSLAHPHTIPFAPSSDQLDGTSLRTAVPVLYGLCYGFQLHNSVEGKASLHRPR